MSMICLKCQSVTFFKSLENVTIKIVSTYILKQMHSKLETVLGTIEASVNTVSI